MIRSVRVMNFKCFRNLDLAISNLTLLTGLNGMGKSSLIQSLLVLRQSLGDGMLSEGSLSLNGELVKLGTGKDVLNIYDDEEVISIEFSDEEKDFKWIFQYDSDGDVLVTKQEDSHNYNSVLFNKGFQYLNAERVGPRTTFPISKNRVVNDREIGTQGEFTAHFLSENGDELVALPSTFYANRGLSLSSQVEAWMSDISPGIRLHLTKYSEADLINLQYSFGLNRDVTNPFRAANVGFGITYTLPVVVAVLSARPGDLLIIENPEAHLHPRGQSIMGSMLAKAASDGVQILIETHSDHVLNGVRLAVHDGDIPPGKVCFHFFKRNESSEASSETHIVESPIIDRNGRLSFWPDGFFDEMDRALEALLAPAN